MTRMTRLFVLAAVLCAPPPLAAGQEALGKRVSLDLKAMAPAEAFSVLADAVGTKVTVDPEVTAPVDILVRNVTARTALTTICESIGCRWTADSTGITVKPEGQVRIRSAVRRDERVVVPRKRANVERTLAVLKRPLPPGLKFDNTPLADVSARLSEALKLSIAITTDDEAFQRITADFSNVTLQAALRSVVEQAGQTRVRWRLALSTADPDSPSIAIVFGAAAPKKPGAGPKKMPRNR